jgi:hypothetical protein
LLATPGVRFYSLQKGASAIATQGIPALVDFGPHLENFADTAAAIAQLDLVIGVDTSVVHLAGAHGKPVWTLIPVPADWRWLEDREDTPWYPTMRLFRQRGRGDWDEVIQRVKSALELELRERGFRADTVEPIAPLRSRFAVRYPVMISQVAQTRMGLMQYRQDDDEGRSIAFYGEYRQPELDVLARVITTGMTVLEVNAGVGIHTLWLSRSVGPEGLVLVYENDRLRRQILQQNLRFGGVDNVTVMQACMKCREDAVVDSDNVRNGTFANNRVETVDDLQLRRLGCLKITRPDGVLGVLDGAPETLWHLRPRLVITFSGEEDMQRLTVRLHDFGYTCCRTDTRLFNGFNFNRRDEDIFDGRTAVVVIAYPEEDPAGQMLGGCRRIE